MRRILGAAFALAASLSMTIGLGVASAETPAERCKRETTTYNNAWRSTWTQANPGKSPSDAPPPPVPYRCGGGNNEPPPMLSPPEPTPETTKETARPKTSAPPSATPGPNMNAPTERREIEHPGTGQKPVDKPPIGSATVRPSLPLTRSQVPDLGRELAAKECPEGQKPQHVMRNPGAPTSIECVDNPKEDGDGTGYDGLSPGPMQDMVCAANPIDCARAVSARDDSFESANRAFPLKQSGGKYTGINDENDAMRHCVWQALTTKRSNSGFAEAIGDAHESDGGQRGTPGSQMDLGNNATGRY